MTGSPPISSYISDLTDYRFRANNGPLSANFSRCGCGVEFTAPKDMLLRCSKCQALRAEFFVAANPRPSPKEAA